MVADDVADRGYHGQRRLARRDHKDIGEVTKVEGSIAEEQRTSRTPHVAPDGRSRIDSRKGGRLQGTRILAQIGVVQ
jgi:hypothetical protein